MVLGSEVLLQVSQQLTRSGLWWYAVVRDVTGFSVLRAVAGAAGAAGVPAVGFCFAGFRSTCRLQAQWVPWGF